MSGLVRSLRDGREKRFIAPRERWQFLLAGFEDAQLEFPLWVPWALVFTLVRRYQELVAVPGFAGYSADLQAIELKRSVVPLMERLVSEGVGTQEFAVAEGGASAVLVAEVIRGMIESCAA